MGPLAGSVPLKSRCQNCPPLLHQAQVGLSQSCPGPDPDLGSPGSESPGQLCRAARPSPLLKCTPPPPPPAQSSLPLPPPPLPSFPSPSVRPEAHRVTPVAADNLPPSPKPPPHSHQQSKTLGTAQSVPCLEVPAARQPPNPDAGPCGPPASLICLLFTNICQLSAQRSRR